MLGIYIHLSVSCFGVLEDFAATKNLPAARKNFVRVDREFTSFLVDSREQITDEDRGSDHDGAAASPDHLGGAASEYNHHGEEEASPDHRGDDYGAAVA